MIKPTLFDKVETAQRKHKFYHDLHAKSKTFDVDDRVYSKDICAGNSGLRALLSTSRDRSHTGSSQAMVVFYVVTRITSAHVGVMKDKDSHFLYLPKPYSIPYLWCLLVPQCQPLIQILLQCLSVLPQVLDILKSSLVPHQTHHKPCRHLALQLHIPLQEFLPMPDVPSAHANRRGDWTCSFFQFKPNNARGCNHIWLLLCMSGYVCVEFISI